MTYLNHCQIGPKALKLMLLACFFVLAKPASAHSVAWNQQPSDQTITLSFIYSDQSPMAYSQVKVFSPADSQIEYQNARTDRSGIFAFRPDVPGQWSFEVNDGQGHLAQGDLVINSPEPVAAAADSTSADTPAEAALEAPLASGGAPKVGLIRVLLGLSLILNLGLITFKIFRRRPKPA
ncbi:MAG: DUF4198 domain-containing protein [Deltaproteobacteria bacterium]|nr:DUF4198 domain-containing protein [Deltaproteobacteria bacterium]